MLNFLRPRPFGYACPQCGNLHTGSSYHSDTKQYCSFHARAIAEEKHKDDCYRTECLQYRKQVEGLIAQLKAADKIKAQTAAQWAEHYNNHVNASNPYHGDYQYAEADRQRQALSVFPLGF